MSGLMTQEAPFPVALERLVAGAAAKEGWRFALGFVDRGQGCRGLTLTIVVSGPNAYHPEQTIGVVHMFPVPAAAYNVRTWCRWLRDRVADVETHEAGAFFTIDGGRPYPPSHGDGDDPYTVVELGDTWRASARPGQSGPGPS